MPLKTITVTDLKVIKSGLGKNGDAYTLRGVEAHDSNGTPIVGTLKTFDELPLGQAIQVDVQTKSDEWGTEYILRLPRGSGGYNAPPQSSAPAQTDLGPRVAKLEEQVHALIARAGAVPPPPPMGGGAGDEGDDIPFAFPRFPEGKRSVGRWNGYVS